jgi:glycosyltransferase involved in cell wall biosynthesis
MLPALTVGITTHNEKDNIRALLDRLSLLDESLIHVILYDDKSTDGTADLIAAHPIFGKPHFRACLANENFGSPSKGRKYIADHASTPYVTFVDGDDLIDPQALTIVARRLPQGFDIIVTPFMSGERRQFPAAFDNNRPISNDTIARLLSGIGGKIYNREALVLHTLDTVKGRSEDVRLNMRILIGGFGRVHFEDTKPFYFITTSRKSTLAKNILLHEIAARVSNYQILKERYGVNDIYIKGLHRNLLKVVREDPSLSLNDRLERFKDIHDTMPFRLKRIIYFVRDLSEEHEFSRLVQDTLTAAKGRSIQHICIAVRGSKSERASDALVHGINGFDLYRFLYDCHTTDTAVVTSGNSVQSLPLPIRDQLNQFPHLHLSLEPLYTMMEAAEALADVDFVDSYKAARILCSSELDVSFHRQMGISEVAKIKLPVSGRERNSYSHGRDRFVVCIRGLEADDTVADQLIALAQWVTGRGLPPLQVFVGELNTSGLKELQSRLSATGLSEWIEIHGSDTEAAFAHATLVLLPSRTEGFGNVLKAFSYGVPVIAHRYAPGPSEAIRPDQDGFLLEDFSTGTLVTLLEGLSAEQLALLSGNCFERHREFSMEQYLSLLEAHATESAREFPGQNTVRVFPLMRAVEVLTTQDIASFLMMRFRVRQKLFDWRIYLVEKVLPKRVAKALRWVKARLQ